MAKFDVSFSATSIVFVDSKGKAEPMDTFAPMSPVEAMRTLDKGWKADKSLSMAAVSALNDIMQSPRLDGYKGTCPINEKTPNELSAAIRELEIEYFKPVFTQYHASKSSLVELEYLTPDEVAQLSDTDRAARAKLTIEHAKRVGYIEKIWQDWAKDLKAAGSYAVAKTFVTRYFAYCGKLPLCENGQLLTVAAIKKLLENIEKPAHTNEGIAGRLVKISAELQTADADKMGDFATAIAALKAMLSTYELQHAQALEALTDAIGNTEITEQSKPSAMQRAPAPSIQEQAQAITDKAYLATKHARHASLTHNDVESTI